jgi:trehalose-phosphatase
MIRNDVARVSADFGDWVGAGGALLLLTDFDGTLAPLAPDPGEVRASAAVRQALAALPRPPEISVAIISGRDIGDLRARLDIQRLIYAGCHGLEVSGPDLAFRHPDAERQRPTIEAVARSLAQSAPGVPGMQVEPKRLAVAVHYRGVAPGAVAEVESRVGRAIRQSAARLEVLRGKHVLEILPHVGWHKGACALWIRSQVLLRLRGPARLLYLGDDASDEPAFQALRGKATTVRIGPEDVRSAATHRFDDVAGVEHLLEVLARAAGRRAA